MFRINLERVIIPDSFQERTHLSSVKEIEYDPRLRVVVSLSSNEVVDWRYSEFMVCLFVYLIFVFLFGWFSNFR